MRVSLLIAMVSAGTVATTNLLILNPLPQGVGNVPAADERHSAPSPALIEERVVDLPEDGNTWHTILILHPEWRTLPAERRAESMFHSEPLLVSLKHQTHWHLITTDQAEFGKFRPLVGATPCLILERANGEVVYRESGPDLCRRPHALTHAIRREIQRHCPDGRCLPLHPVPDRDDVPSEPNEVPTMLREELPEPGRRMPLPLVASALAGLVAGVAAHWKRKS